MIGSLERFSAGITGTRIRLAAVITVLSLIFTACGRIESPQEEGSGSDSGAEDGRPIKAGGTLRVGLENEPDVLDPSLARTLVGRYVFNSICEKLYDIDEDLSIVPQLAESLPKVSEDGKTATIKVRSGLKFADGTELDAAAVKTSLDRHRTVTGSQRKSELLSVTEVTVADSSTVEIHLSEPFAPLPAVLADRAGMVMSPTALNQSGANFGTSPVCIGPFKFASRLAQDRIEVVKDSNYYDADKVKLDKIVYLTIADDNTRYNNLRSGDIDVQFEVSPINVAEAKGVGNLRMITNESLGYQGITINLANANGVGEDPGTLGAPWAGPLADEAKVRKAFMHTIDREALVRSVWRDVYEPACGPISPDSPLSTDDIQACPKFDPEESKRLLKDAGVQTPFPISLTVPNDPDNRRAGEAIKSMAEAGGFAVQIEPTEFASALDLGDAGQFQSFRLGWSGRVDPDGNLAQFVTTRGSQNIAGYSNDDVDSWVKQARTTQDVDERKELYGKVVKKLHEDVPIIYLWRQKNILGINEKVGGIKMFVDGIARFGSAGFVE